MITGLFRARRPVHRALLLGALCLATYLSGMPAGAAAARASLRMLATLAGGPDDLAIGPRGSLYVSLVGAGEVVQLFADGRRRAVGRGLRAPEGIVPLPDGTLLVAEQGRNRIVRLDPRTGAVRTFVWLANRAGREGVDGIRRDPRDGSLLVPDSPNGRLLRVSADGARISVLSGGLGRPVDVALDRRGRPVVVDETLGGAFAAGPAGVRRLGGPLSVPDDIVPDGAGGFYVTCLGDATLRHIAADGTTALVAAGLPNPQGLLRRADGSLVVAEEDTGRLVVVTPHDP